MYRLNHSLTRYFRCLATLVWLAGCREAILPTVKPPAASLVFEKFCPVDEFRQLGYQVKSFSGDARISPKEIYAWRAFHGTIALPDGVSGCDSVCTGIHQCLEAAVDDGTVEESKSDPHTRLLNRGLSDTTLRWQKS
jgi:hypothetical protein